MFNLTTAYNATNLEYKLDMDLENNLNCIVITIKDNVLVFNEFSSSQITKIEQGFKLDDDSIDKNTRDSIDTNIGNLKSFFKF